MRCISLLAALVVAVPVAAQTCIYTWGTDPMGTVPPRANGAGFWYGVGAPPSTDLARFHLLFPATLFNNVPTLITEFSLPVREGWQRLRFGHVTIRMGQTTHTQLSSTFAQNITSPLQDVLVADDYVLFQGIGPAWAPVGMQQPFQFLPGRGDLLVEVIQTSAALLEDVSFTGYGNGYVGTMVVAAPQTPLPVVGAPPTSVGLRFRFCVDHPELSLSGVACGGSSNTPPQLGLSGTPAIGGQTTLWLSNAPANGLSMLAFGFDNRAPYPVDLAALGAPGCQQYFPIAFTVAVVANALGTGQYAVTVPNSTSLVGSIVLGQYIVLRPGSNAAGALLSNYGRILVGR